MIKNINWMSHKIEFTRRSHFIKFVQKVKNTLKMDVYFLKFPYAL